jgi:hypothetical protein
MRDEMSKSPRRESEALETQAGELSLDSILQRFLPVPIYDLNEREQQISEHYYLMGHADGAAAMRVHLERLNAENDRLYLRAYNSPEKIREIYQRRLDGHFDREAELFFRRWAS